jgi:CsoR family transcriptional regulator, copper-sensing transcriptional repressor
VDFARPVARRFVGAPFPALAPGRGRAAQRGKMPRCTCQYLYPVYVYPVTPDVHERAKKRIRRIAGQVAGIERMIDEDRYCVDILLQVAAVRAALDGMGKLILRSHLETCVTVAIASGRPKERKEKIGELMEVFSKFSNIGSK